MVARPPGSPLLVGQVLPPEVEQALLQLRDQAVVMNQNLQSQAALIQTLTDLLGAFFLAGQRSTLPVTQTNIGPDQINLLLMQGADSGRITPDAITFDVVIPAGLTWFATFTIPQGSIGIFLETAKFFTSYHDPLITIQIYADNREMLDYPVSLSHDREIPVSRIQYALRRFPTDTMVFRIWNGTAHNISVSMHAFAVFVEKSLHDSVIVPLVIKASQEINILQGVQQP